ncbi:hypothetical protein HWD35_14430 [Tsukamurella tyrosinosolvens]|uniref:hypothetical protein n=1 Tax=Tsukamurella tyrosinosolvens TaxID=57704 RepID=UPI00079B6259|nr:hypothetical protein [Tsukamurella tyrosinosolvens]KXP07940.1 hypothetical protein AXK59_01290 [Tsukamurella tyrosinosolvens]KZL97501.1 hypothetical protein AXX05_00595 [Tsukamurella tyrosinosolvens]MCA4995912.1 hypothetical protein [Tsukamurella tyrosinosolvens]
MSTSATEPYYPAPPVSACTDSSCRDMGAVDVDGDGQRDAVGWIRRTTTQELVVRMATGATERITADYHRDSDLIAAIDAWFIELNGVKGAEIVLPVDANAGLKWYDVITWSGGRLNREAGFGPDTVAPTNHWSFGNEDDSADLVRCTGPGAFEWTKLRIPYPGPARDWARTGVIDYRLDLSAPIEGHRFREVGRRSSTLDEARRALAGTDYRYPFACRMVIPVPTAGRSPSGAARESTVGQDLGADRPST